MKRYWKAITTTIVVVFFITTYYIHSAISTTGLPDFSIQKIKGDASLVSDITIQGTDGQKLVEITTTGSTYENERPISGQLFGDPPPIIKQLIKKHRTFMRGKEWNIASFYEDKRFLAYANIIHQKENFIFKVSILDKKEDASTSFNLPVPNAEMIDDMEVEDVQIMNGDLEVITNNGTKTGSEIHVYSISTETKKLVSDINVLSGYGSTSIMSINESQPKSHHQFMAFDKITDIEPDHEQSVNDTGETEEQHTFIAYNLGSKQKKQIALPKKFNDATEETVDGSHLYFIDNNKNGVKVIPYDLANGKMRKVLKVQVTNTKDTDDVPLAFIQHEHLYLLSPYHKEDSSAILKVVDLSSGDILYKGKVAEKNQKSGKDKYNMFFSHMEMR